MRATALLLCSVLAAGCGNWSDEDAEFQAAVPNRDDLTLRSPEASTQTQSLESGDLGTRQDGLGQRTEVYETVTSMAKQVNHLVQVVTAGLDLVRKVSPTEREPGRRVWGPYDDRDRPGFEVRVEMRRDDAGPKYTYEVQWRRRNAGEFVSIITGQFRGERATRGTGSFEFHRARALAQGIADEDAGEFTLSYDMTGNAAAAQMQGTTAAGRALDIRYRVARDGGGWLKFEADADLDHTTAAQERLAISAIWLADRSGRSETTASGGDLGAVTGSMRECWDASQGRVWWERNFECGGTATCSDGDEANCSVATVE